MLGTWFVEPVLVNFVSVILVSIRFGVLTYVLETAFAYRPDGVRRQKVLGLNFSPRLSDPFYKLDWCEPDGGGSSLDTFLEHQRVTADEPTIFALHLRSVRVCGVHRREMKP
jgi:hypothetical protein